MTAGMTPEPAAHRPLRVLFVFAATQAFFDGSMERKQAVGQALKEAFADLQGRFGVRVLAALDDDQLAVGPSLTWPWTAYIIAEAPDLDQVVQVCDLVRSTSVGDDRLSRFIRIEARIGRPLFFAPDA
jgi:hypothetical protein